MRSCTFIFLTVIAALSCGCSNTRFLAEDQLLYTGIRKVEIIKEQNQKNTTPVKPYVLSTTSQKPNNSLFGKRVLLPVGLWVYNYTDVDNSKKFKKWIFKTFSKPPVLISDINPDLRAQKIENDLFDLGYFDTKAWARVDTSSRNSKKARISYHVQISSPYRYNRIEYDSARESIDTLVTTNNFNKLIAPGDQFNLEKLILARTGLSRQIQNRGFFFFNPDHIGLIADTALGNKQLNLLIRRQEGLPKVILSTYRIDSLQVHITGSSDSAVFKMDTTLFDGMTIVSSGDHLKPGVVRDAVFFRTGELYTYDTYQNTITRLNNLGVFSYVRISYELPDQDSMQQLLEVKIDLVMADPVSLELETDLVAKSTGFAGPAVSAGISHGNSFKGAEKINFAIKGGIEWQWGQKQESQLGTFSYELGANLGFTFPKIILPGKKTEIKKILKQQTSINQDFNILNRTAYYTMFSALTKYNYSWGKTREVLHSYSPVYFNTVSLLATTPAFDSVVNENIYIRRSFEEQFILGTKYEFSYDNTHKNQPGNIYLQVGLSSAGNLIDLFAGLRNDASGRPYEVFNNVYSQHVKVTTDLRYYLNGYNKTLAMRLYSGIGIPYANSTVLPYVEQFFSGGGYSVRGFLARTIGPGSFHDTESSFIDQSGDLKLEGNLEYRFEISSIIKGAVFVETGNIWLINEDENRPGSQFNFNTFYRQLAVGAGVGLRFDFNFFVLRTDLGFPLRTPYIEDDSNWLIGNQNILSRGLFYLAIGYPF